MNAANCDTDRLLRRAADGDLSAAQTLLDHHRKRLKRMVQVHLDDRLAARVDPSDVVQESLLEASRRLCEYAQQRPVAFYPWLRTIAWQRLLKVHQHHLAQKRSVTRERHWDFGLSDASAAELVSCFDGSQTSPSQRVARAERQLYVRRLIEQLAPRDREVLVLRYLEQLSPGECAEVLEVSHEAYVKRHMRAVQRLRKLLESASGESL